MKRFYASGVNHIALIRYPLPDGKTRSAAINFGSDGVTVDDKTAELLMAHPSYGDSFWCADEHPNRQPASANVQIVDGARGTQDRAQTYACQFCGQPAASKAGKMAHERYCTKKPRDAK